MNPGDKVKLVDAPTLDWMYPYRDKVFELIEIMGDSCKVRLHEEPHPEWYWFVDKGNFALAEQEKCAS
tara:strand:- start:547 stop:750 length:204 start_codon:yes stop_codon:yes gene_type:complete